MGEIFISILRVLVDTQFNSLGEIFFENLSLSANLFQILDSDTSGGQEGM